jgi:hypothetical protein
MRILIVQQISDSIIQSCIFPNLKLLLLHVGMYFFLGFDCSNIDINKAMSIWFKCKFLCKIEIRYEM